jgi:hypothetical protein
MVISHAFDISWNGRQSAFGYATDRLGAYTAVHIAIA